jgi:hypothetical protein
MVEFNWNLFVKKYKVYCGVLFPNVLWFEFRDYRVEMLIRFYNPNVIWYVRFGFKNMAKERLEKALRLGFVVLLLHRFRRKAFIAGYLRLF